MAENKKFYWLKLKRDFFKRHDIRIIEEMPNGKDYILFYLKLLLESIDHEGRLRFSETIPYNENMLAVITNTNIDIVKSAMKIFNQLNMVEILDDSTIYMNEVNKLIGCETSVAERVRKHRENAKMLQCNTDVTKCNTEIDIDKDIDIELNKDIEIKKEKNINEEKELIEATPFSQQIILKLFKAQYIVRLEDYDDYVNAIESLAQEYDKQDIEDRVNELINNESIINIPTNSRLAHIKELMQNCSKIKEDDDLPF